MRRIGSGKWFPNEFNFKEDHYDGEKIISKYWCNWLIKSGFLIELYFKNILKRFFGLRFLYRCADCRCGGGGGVQRIQFAR